MYFTDRTEAGKLLTEQLLKYKGKKCTLVALSDGAVVVAAQIAAVLECPITMLMASPIIAPGEPDAVASINQEGTYSFNSSYSSGQHEEFDMEYHHVFEQQKLDRLSEMHRLLGRNELIRKDLLKGRTVILVSDGLGSAATVDSAALFLKSIKVKRLVIVTPFAAINVVDRMHILGDDIACLNVLQNYMGTDHYYENNKLPSHEVIIKSIQNMVKNWKG
jgi:putative phosphoribosyl transferase